MREADADYCRFEVEGRLLGVTINRPEVMNALHLPASRALATAFDRFAEDPELWVAIITGAGERAFCARNASKDYVEGPLAFAQKRKPNWKGE